MCACSWRVLTWSSAGGTASCYPPVFWENAFSVWLIPVLEKGVLILFLQKAYPLLCWILFCKKYVPSCTGYSFYKKVYPLLSWEGFSSAYAPSCWSIGSCVPITNEWVLPDWDPIRFRCTCSLDFFVLRLLDSWSPVWTCGKIATNDGYLRTDFYATLFYGLFASREYQYEILWLQN